MILICGTVMEIASYMTSLAQYSKNSLFANLVTDAGLYLELVISGVAVCNLGAFFGIAT